MTTWWTRTASVVGALAGSMARALYVPKNVGSGSWREIGEWTATGGGSLRRPTEWLQKFEDHPWLKSAVKRVAEDMASLRWRLFEELPGDTGADGRPKRKAVRRHPLLDLWAKPNPHMVGYIFRYLVQIYIELCGEAPILVQFSSGARGVEALWVVPPHWVRKLPTASDPWFSVWLPETAGAGAEERFHASEVIWLHSPTAMNPYSRGLGTMSAVADEIELDETSGKWNRSFFQNGASPGGLMLIPGLDKSAEARLREQWEARHGGFRNAFRMAFAGYSSNVQGSARPQFVDLSRNHKDLDFIQGRKLSRDIILQAGLNLPPEVMGIVENSNRATAEAAVLIYQTNVLRPRAEFLRESWAAWLLPLLDRTGRLCWESEDPVQESKQWRGAHSIELFKAGILTRNEARVSNEIDPEEGGDVYLEPLNTSPVPRGGVRPAEDARGREEADQ